jgi:hypothetical protein
MTRHKLDLEIFPDENLVSVTRRFLEEVYERVTGDFDTVGRMALAAHELIENAVKYGAGSPARVCVDWTSSGDEGGHVSVQVSNQAGPAQVAALSALFGEMAEEPDAFIYYQAVMKRNAKKTESSGLGLARIRAEGDFDLTMECEGDRVCLCARGAFGGAA